MGFGQQQYLPTVSFTPQNTNADPNDFSERYNTKLSPEEEARYQEWAQREGRAKDVYDYDLRGAWKELQSGDMAEDARGHLGDKYKKPNHPTFSDQSKYNGAEGFAGGTWSEENGKVVYRASKSNRMSKAQLARYFKEMEPDVVLIDER